MAEARQAAHLTQEDLAEALGLDRTAITKIEAGRRQLGALELLNIASTLRRLPEWFVSIPPPAVVSRRAERMEGATFRDIDALIEELARDVELLVEVDELRPPATPALSGPVVDLQGAEGAAALARLTLDCPTGPLLELQSACERLGLYGFSLDVGHPSFDGAYVGLDRGGVALVSGAVNPGRRRFNLAHELGHHVLADEYSNDFALGESKDDSEKIINAFAVHLLMPRDSITQDWAKLEGEEHPREALVTLAARYRVSWSAACNHLLNLGILQGSIGQQLLRQSPTRADYVESGVIFVEELAPPSVPPTFGQAAIRAFRKQKLGPRRVIELLRGTISEDELPPPHQVPLDAFRGELSP